jgi:hypothetical protein
LVFVCTDNIVTHGDGRRIHDGSRKGWMLFERAFPCQVATIPCQVEWRARLAAASGGRQGVHPLHVQRHRDEAPLTLDLVKATQEELKAHKAEKQALACFLKGG